MVDKVDDRGDGSAMLQCLGVSLEMILIERLLNTWNLLALITSNDNTCMIIDLHLYRDAIFVRVSIFKLIESV